MNTCKPLFFIAILCSGLIFSCTKDRIIEDNVAPPDPTVENITKENYVNRAYIAILGRKATPSEFTSAYNLVDAGNLSKASRRAVVDLALLNDEYYDNLYFQAKSRLLAGADTTAIASKIFVLQILLTDPLYQLFWPQIQEGINDLQALLDCPDDLKAGILDVTGMHRRMVDNPIYDDLNMGSQNFVISTFQNFLLRYPTTYELTQGILIVDGFNGIIFLTDCSSKNEYLDTFFASTDYFEGQVLDLFGRFLYRTPTSIEMAELSQAFKLSGDYEALLKSVLTTDEYAGIN